MSWFSLLAVALVLVAAGCGSGGGHPAASATTKAQTPCKLNKAQRRAVAKALADIRGMRHIESQLQTYSARGAPKENQLTGKFLLDLGSANLPLDVFSRLIHLAKGAVRLCGDCSTGLESEEPFLGNRGQNRERCVYALP
jgi:hypothetical protein